MGVKLSPEKQAARVAKFRKTMAEKKAGLSDNEVRAILDKATPRGKRAVRVGARRQQAYVWVAVPAALLSQVMEVIL